MTKNLRVAYALALLAIVWTLTIAPARAQSVYGSIFGTVTDTTGAVVPGATVTVTDVAKGTVDTILTNGSGDYTASHLVPDTYSIKVELKGFKTYTAKGIVVQADTAPRVDVALEVAGSAGETIEVNADVAPQLKTDRADVSTVFNQQEVNNLPVGDQNFTNLQLLLPGAQLLGWSHAASENPQASKQIQIDGQAFGGVAFELDGTDNQDPILGIIVVNPSLDSVTEAKITTQNFDAELGKAVSAVVTVQTKSGSNTFHGSAYDFRTSNANLARDPFAQPPGVLFPGGLKNKFGGSFGGRVIKDRLFFFGAYEGQRQRVGVTQVNTLPSQNLTESCLGNIIGSGAGGIAGCDFSEYLANLPGAGTPYPQGTIYDQSKTHVVDGVTQPVPFDHNVIPAGLVSKQFINLLTILEPYTKQESGGVLGGLASNSKASGTGLFNSDLWATRIDATISQKMNAFGRFSRWTDTLTGAGMYGEAGGPGLGLAGYGGQSKSADDSVAAGTDYVFNPKLVADLRLGYLRYNIITSKYDQGTDFATSLGMPGLNTGSAVTSGSPAFFVASLPQGQQPLFGSGLGINRCNCPLTEREDQFQIVNNWTKTLGNHELKFGADLRYGRNLRAPSDSNRSGEITFGTNPTSNQEAPGSTSAQTNYQGGLGYATFALGEVTQLNRYVSTSTNAKEFQKRTFFYGQDTWRATSKLTLNLGLRWELYFPESVNAKGNGALMDLSDGYLHVAGYGNVPSNMGWGITKWKQLEPRIGVAYQMNPKTVIRAGYGRSFDIGVFGSIFGHVVTQNLPVLANQSINSTGSGQAFCIGSPDDNKGCNPDRNGNNQQPVAGGPLAYTPPAVPSNGLLPNPGSQVNTKTRPNPLRFPTLDAWNLSVQRALTSGLSLTLAYIGNKGTHTLSDGDNNGTNPNEPAIFLPGSFSVNGQTLHFDPKAPSVPTASGATSNTNLLRRYVGGKLKACSDPLYSQPTDPNGNVLPTGSCGWTQDITNYSDDRDTNFEAMQVTLRQGTWKGLSATANYQWASAFAYNSGYSTWDKSVNYGRDSNVRQHAATLYGSYDLPFGKGKQFFTGASRITDLVIGGFQLSGTMNLSTGLPFTASINCGSDIPSDAPCYPDTHGRMPTSLSGFKPGTGWTFYKAQTLGTIFTDPGLDKIGNGGRNTYWGPGFFNTDLSLVKAFKIWEGVDAKLRMDAYNAVNHINPGNPGGNVLSDGVITGQAPGPGPRQLEFAFRVQF